MLNIHSFPEKIINILQTLIQIMTTSLVTKILLLPYHHRANVMLRRGFQSRDQFAHHHINTSTRETRQTNYNPQGPLYSRRSSVIHPSLRRKLNENPEDIVNILRLVENDNLSNSEYIRLGNRGSLCVTREVSCREFMFIFLTFMLILEE